MAFYYYGIIINAILVFYYTYYVLLLHGSGVSGLCWVDFLFFCYLFPPLPLWFSGVCFPSPLSGGVPFCYPPGACPFVTGFPLRSPSYPPVSRAFFFPGFPTVFTGVSWCFCLPLHSGCLACLPLDSRCSCYSCGVSCLCVFSFFLFVPGALHPSSVCLG